MELRKKILKIINEMVTLRDIMTPANPGKILHHYSSYKNRESIQKNGLVPKVGRQTSNFMSHNFEGIEPIPLVFAQDTKHGNYFGVYGNDLWEIDTQKAGVKWYDDPIHKDDGNNWLFYVTMEKIPPHAIKLISSNEQKDDDMEIFRQTGEFPNRGQEIEEPKKPEEPSVWDKLNKEIEDVGLGDLEIDWDEFNKISPQTKISESKFPIKEDKHYDFLFLDYKFTKGLEFVINRLMSRKFDWFNSFKLNSVMVNSMSPWEGIHVFYLGVLNVDENWGEKMWIEEGQYGKFPGNREYDFDKYSGVLLNELVGSRIMSEISEVFNFAFRGVRPIEDTPRVSRVGRLLLHFDKSKKEDNLQETIKRVLKQQTELKERCWPGYTQKGMKTMFGKRYPNCVKKKKK